jgi:hypothetical protein
VFGVAGYVILMELGLVKDDVIVPDIPPLFITIVIPA